MTNPVIDFLRDRKERKLKNPGKKTASEIEEDLEAVNWISHAAKRSNQLKLVSHPGKFSHPDARISPVFSEAERIPDGYLRTGNVEVSNDVVGNAAALDIYAFLCVKLDDGEEILTHFEDYSETLKSLLNTDDEQFSEWRNAFLSIKLSDQKPRSHQNVKQVYFPVDKDYHLLSVLYPSGLMDTHRQRIRQMKFSEATKASREARKNNQISDAGYSDLPGLLTQRFGGSKPQNISKLNSNNGGEAWLLPSLPPTLSDNIVRLPKKDFFETLSYQARYRAAPRRLFEDLHKIFVVGHNNTNIDRRRQGLLARIFEWILAQALVLQNLPAGWSEAMDNHLPSLQKTWLDSGKTKERQDDEWQDEISRQIVKCVLVSYRRSRSHRKDAVDLGRVEAVKFQSELEDCVRANKAFLF